MSEDDLARLIDLAKRANVTAQDREAQRRSFAYGNTHFENEDITRETVARAAEQLANDAKD